MKNYYRQSHFTVCVVFPGLWPVELPSSFSKTILLFKNFAMKKRVNEAQNTRLIFPKAAPSKIQGCVELRIPGMNMVD